MQRWSRRLTLSAGLTGVIVLMLAIWITALAYIGSSGERYSPFNHFISELGHTTESEAAAIMNSALLIGGLLFSLFMIGTALRFRGVVRPLLLITGVFVGLSGGMVGIYPMDVDLVSHAIVAIGFFAGMLLMLTLFMIATALARSSVYPRWLAALPVPAIICSAIFLYLLVQTGAQTLAAPAGERDPVLPITVVEWGALTGLLIWVIAIAVWQMRQPD